MKKRLNIIQIGILATSCILLGTKVGQITKEEGSIINFINEENNKILNRNDAEELGYLIKNPTYDDLIKTVNNNPFITNEYGVKDYFYEYIESICNKYPNLDKSILQKNIELIKINYLTKEEIIEKSQNKYTMAFFDANLHELNLCKDLPLYNVIHHEISHMLRNLIYLTEDNKKIVIKFANSEYGMALEEEINTVFTNKVLYNEAAYQKNNIYLLEKIIPEDKLLDIYFNEDIDGLIDYLEKINYNISAKIFVKLHDHQNNNYFDNDDENNYDYDIHLYDMYIDYFLNKEKKDKYQNFDKDFEEFEKILLDIKTKEESQTEILNKLNTNKNYIKKRNS